MNVGVAVGVRLGVGVNVGRAATVRVRLDAKVATAAV